MKAKSSGTRTDARSLCADLHPDDGPPTTRRKEQRDHTIDTKTLQLCAQVRRALHESLPALGSPFTNLIVESVEPNPDASRMLVVVSVGTLDGLTLPQVRQQLANRTGFLRAEVSRAIHRKRTPGLTLELIPREDAQ